MTTEALELIRPADLRSSSTNGCSVLATGVGLASSEEQSCRRFKLTVHKN